jgi:hypothetical protein
MSSSSVDNDSGAEERTINGDDINGNAHTPTQTSNGNGNENRTQLAAGRITELLQEERGNATTPEPLGNGTNRYKAAKELDTASEDESLDALPRRAGSPIDSILSIPDDSPSIQVRNAPQYLKRALTLYVGFNTFIACRKQHTSFSCLPAWAGQSHPIFQTI